MKQPNNPFKIAFLLSGSGSTLENLLNYIVQDRVKATVSIVISSREDAFGIKRAENWGIPYEIISYNNYKPDLEAYSKKITQIIDSYNVDLLVFGGFMSRYLVPNHYKNKVINIHPALIPSFCGQGFYGDKVHKAVLEHGVKVTGCTVHFVDNDYDTGPIIAQEPIKVEDDDTQESLTNKVKELEQSLYPKVIQDIIENRFIIEGRKVKTIDKK